MVPEVDKRDTELLLKEQREILEATRQEIEALPLLGKNKGGASEALRKLAARSAQQARQWTGQMLGELGTSYPYANSLKPENQTIDPSTVQAKADYFPAGEQTLISRVKFARLTLQGVDKELETLLAGCKPYTRFNQFLFKVQEHAMQSKMWLGELLHELSGEQAQTEPAAYEPVTEAKITSSSADGQEMHFFNEQPVQMTEAGMEWLRNNPELATSARYADGSLVVPPDAATPVTEDPQADYVPAEKTAEQDESVSE